MSDLNSNKLRINNIEYDCSTTHLNSIHKIRNDVFHSKEPSFKKGNWLINISFENYVAIFDSQIKKLLWYKNLNLKNPIIHDVQLLKNGQLLIYHNNFYNNSKGPLSEVIEYDPIELKVTKNYHLLINNHQFLKSSTGSIQLLDSGKILFSAYSEKKGEVLLLKNASGKLELIMSPNYNPIKKIGENFQDGKIVDLSSYLKNNLASF